MFILLKMVHRKCILTDVNIPHLHKSHDAPYLPPKILQKHCFQFLLGRLYYPGEMKNKGYAKFEGEGVGGGHIKCTTGDVQVACRAFSLAWPASVQIYCNKRKRLHKKRVQLPQDWFGTPIWPPFYCFGTPIWPPWNHGKTLYIGKTLGDNDLNQVVASSGFSENKGLGWVPCLAGS